MINSTARFAVEKYPKKTMITIMACVGNAGTTNYLEKLESFAFFVAERQL